MAGERIQVFSIFGDFLDLRLQIGLRSPRPEIVIFSGFFIRRGESIEGLIYDLEQDIDPPVAKINGVFIDDEVLQFEKEYFNGVPPKPIQYKLGPVIGSNRWVGRYSLEQPDGTFLREMASCQLTEVEPTLALAIGMTIRTKLRTFP